MVATNERTFAHVRPSGRETFSPLFIGAMVATEFASMPMKMSFQSPFHRGNGCYIIYALKISIDASSSSPFSPLFIGAMVATDLAISSRNSSKRRNHLRLYIIRVILTHRRCPVNFKRHKR